MILTQRIQVGMAIVPEQRVFLNSNGLAENLTLLSEILSSATSQLMSVYADVPDVKKALDTIIFFWKQAHLVVCNRIWIPWCGVWRLSDRRSHSLSLVVVGKTWTIYVLIEDTFKLGDKYLTSLGISECWKYLGISFMARGEKSFRKEIEELLRGISEAPLKLYQRMAAVRRWLRIPRDVAMGFCHAPPSASFIKSIPVWILALLRIVSKSGYTTSTCFVGLSQFLEKGGVAQEVGSHFLDSTLKVKNSWKAKLLGAVDGRELEPSKGSKLSTSWIVQMQG
ncbi:hypothetical protein PR048_000743 [Dryococelus australis]|uniref:Uncharacterized protein n=1 Tax=Dryococelus australis TaxID=614101 RepID=A0ABQ9IFL4_9NEOP|nr:hypothetical protein PR048_000743 [Dryococelus australis]